jgi:hypothetical protein
MGNSAQKSTAYLDVVAFLNLVHLPGRFCAWQFAATVGCEEKHVPILIAKRLAKPLGNPPKNGPKYFSRDYVLNLAADERWLARMSDALVEHWADRNKIGKSKSSARYRKSKSEKKREIDAGDEAQRKTL